MAREFLVAVKSKLMLTAIHCLLFTFYILVVTWPVFTIYLTVSAAKCLHSLPTSTFKAGS